ncbi:MAG: hypothetical protein EOM83_04790 [Clostridia bacterium]|nr:hypothetical protein [Clostridia bacterium]
MRNSILKIFFLIATTISFAPSQAQVVDIGLLGGGTYYLGDLNPQQQFLLTKPAYGGLMRFVFNDRWSARFTLLRGEIAGDDALSHANELRNLRFKSSITELSLTAELNFLEYFTGSQIYYFSPYLFGGPAFFIFNPKAPFQGEMLTLRDLGTEGQKADADKYGLYGAAVVFGFGIKYSISQRLGLGVEWGLRKTFTDYLDDVSTNYYVDFTTINPDDIDAAVMLSDPSPIKHAPGMQRGNSENNDWYSFAGITLTYRFRLGEKTTCVDFDYNKK